MTIMLDPQGLDDLLPIIRKLSPEDQIPVVMLIGKLDPKQTRTKAFISWVTDPANKEVFEQVLKQEETKREEADKERS